MRFDQPIDAIREHLRSYSWDSDELVPERGFLTGITGTRANGSGVQRITYDHDPAGHLNLRVDGNRNVTETFEHDSHDRLSHWTFATASGSAWDFKYNYSADGNLISRPGSGPGAAAVSLTYAYGQVMNGVTQPPHAVTGITSGVGQFSGYSYDERGNQILRSDFPSPTFIDYTAFDLPRSIAFDSQPATTLAYDADHHRALVKRSDGSKTFYAGELYERRLANGAANGTNVYYVPGVDRAVAEVVWTEQPQTGVVASRDTIYLHDDHLGSVETITGSSVGTQSFRYEPYGKRINLTDPTQSPGAPNAAVTKGFAFLEHDDSFSGLINMRGRMYDPRAGRFLSPDPIVSNPFNSQSYNRFSYVANHPLSATDPSGLADPEIRETAEEIDQRFADEYEREQRQLYGNNKYNGLPPGIGGPPPDAGAHSGPPAGLTCDDSGCLPRGLVAGRSSEEASRAQNQSLSARAVDFLSGVGLGVRQGGGGPTGFMIPVPSGASSTFEYGRAFGLAAIGALEVYFGNQIGARGATLAVVGSETVVGTAGGLAIAAGGAAIATQGIASIAQAADALRTARAEGGEEGGGAGKGGSGATPTRPYPSGNGTAPPEPGCQWRGPDAPGGPRGGWVNPNNPGESLHPDLSHGGPNGAHWDWNLPGGGRFRIFPDGTVVPK